MLNRVRIKNMFQNDKYTNFNQSVSTYNLNQKTGLLTWNKGFWSSWQKSSDCILPLSPENFINPILTIFSNVLSGWEVPQRHTASHPLALSGPLLTVITNPAANKLF